ncbi:MAG: hypothetical protein A2X78_03910 [Gammaproteobacteria bacterium GWE2_37_16]|nr:MAG: hypothetical protein A2X78_03910 [Gammaproteobacteria bacterium GWE2_37_16]
MLKIKVSKLFLLATILMALGLQACIPVVLVAGVAASGMIVYDNRSSQAIISDRTITYKAQSNLDSDTELRSKAHTIATSFNESVLITGQAPTQELRDLALSLVQKVPNIKHIYNEVTVEEPLNANARSHDMWITTKVKAALLAQKGLHSTQIKIVTENGTVYLLGLVTNGQGQLAAEVTKRVSSVQKVVKAFEYLE